MLIELDELPEGLLHCEANELGNILSGPTLIHLQGKHPEPLFLCVLQHGNENTGWLAVRDLLLRYRGANLPRSISLFISNVEAAQYGVRRLEHQIDYNRIWPGCDSSGTDEHRLMRQVWETMRERGTFVSIDVHNNTGRNPHYGCINKLEPAFINLAHRFSDTIVYFIRPTGVQSLAFAQLCPAVTVECGIPGDEYGVEHASSYIDEILKLESIEELNTNGRDYDLFHTVAIVKVPEHLSIGFEADKNDIRLADAIDELNFREQPAGTRFGWIHTEERIHLEAWNESGQDVAEEYFEVSNGELLTKRPLMPSMLTRDTKIIKQDCLCYLMERIEL